MPAYNSNSTRQLRSGRRPPIPSLSMASQTRPAYNSSSTRQLRSGRRLPTLSTSLASETPDIIMSEGVITGGPSPGTDVNAVMMDEMAAGSRREDTTPAHAQASIMDDTAPTSDFAPSSEDAAPANAVEETIPGGIRPSTPIDGPTGQLSEDAAPTNAVEETIPGGIRPSPPIDGPTGQLSEDAAPANAIEETISRDIEASIRVEASAHVNILDAASDKVTADEDTIMVEEEEDAHFEFDEGGPQVDIPERPAGGSMQPTMTEDSGNEQITDVSGSAQPIVVDESDDEQQDEAPAYIRDLVRRDVSDEDMESDYSDDSSNSGSPRQFSRSSRLQGRLDQLQDNHVGYTIKVLERLIEQIESRDDGEPENNDRQGRSMDEYLLSELNATSRTIGSLDWIIKDIQKYRTKLSRARRRQKEQRAARRV